MIPRSNKNPITKLVELVVGFELVVVDQLVVDLVELVVVGFVVELDLVGFVELVVDFAFWQYLTNNL